MPNADEIQKTLTAPLTTLEELLRTPCEAIRQGINKLNETAAKSGMPKVPVPPEPPRVFTKR